MQLKPGSVVQGLLHHQARKQINLILQLPGAHMLIQAVSDHHTKFGNSC